MACIPFFLAESSHGLSALGENTENESSHALASSWKILVLSDGGPLFTTTLQMHCQTVQIFSVCTSDHLRLQSTMVFVEDMMNFIIILVCGTCRAYLL